MPKKKGVLTTPQAKVMAMLHARWLKRQPMPTRREIRERRWAGRLTTLRSRCSRR